MNEVLQEIKAVFSKGSEPGKSDLYYLQQSTSQILEVLRIIERYEKENEKS